MRFRIVAWPAFKYSDTQDYPARIYSELQKSGSVHVLDMSFRAFFQPHLRIAHMHWDDTVAYGNTFAAIGKAASIRALGAWIHLRRGRLVWTVHNLAPHNLRSLSRFRLFLWRQTRAYLAKSCDGAISLSRTAEKAILAEWPDLAGKTRSIIPIGQEEQTPLPIPASFDLGAVGSLRGNKGIAQLVHVLKEWEGAPLSVVFAGECDPCLERELSALDNPRLIVTLILRRMTTEEFVEISRRTGLHYFGGTEVLNSSTVVRPAEFSRRVLVAQSAASADYAIDAPSCVHLFDPPLTSENLQAALRRSSEPVSPPTGRLWPAIAVQHLAFYDALLAQQGAE